MSAVTEVDLVNQLAFDYTKPDAKKWFGKWDALYLRIAKKASKLGARRKGRPVTYFGFIYFDEPKNTLRLDSRLWMKGWTPERFAENLYITNKISNYIVFGVRIVQHVNLGKVWHISWPYFGGYERGWGPIQELTCVKHGCFYILASRLEATNG